MHTKEGKVGQLGSIRVATHSAGEDMTASTGAISGMHTVRTKKAHVHRFDVALRDCTNHVPWISLFVSIQKGHWRVGGGVGSYVGTHGSGNHSQPSWYGTEDYYSTTVHGHTDCFLSHLFVALNTFLRRAYHLLLLQSVGPENICLTFSSYYFLIIITADDFPARTLELQSFMSMHHSQQILFSDPHLDYIPLYTQYTTNVHNILCNISFTKI